MRLRVALAFVLACIFVVGALGITLYTASEEMENALVEKLVAEEINYLVDRYRENPQLAPQSSSNLKVYIVQTPADEAELPRYLRNLSVGQHEIVRGGEEFHIAVRDVDGARLYLAYDIGLHEQRVSRFKLLLVLSLLAVALISLWLGYWLSGVLVRQITDLARRVNRLSPSSAHERLAQPGQDEEVALLAKAFDDYHARIYSMMRREQEFTANVSHELRTPLTAIRTGCELLATDPAIGDATRNRVAMVSAAAERMTEQIQALLFLAREQELGAAETVLLAECAADAAEPYRAEWERKSLSFTIEIGREAVLALNPQALHLVLTNLIRNAVQYTERGFVRVSYAERRLTVSDSGAGIEPQHLPRLFERFYRADHGQGGIGLGLAIVRRICDHYGWRIEVASEPARGSAFSITFPYEGNSKAMAAHPADCAGTECGR